MNVRKTTSLTTLLAFILLMITSVILYISPQGKVAFWADWECWGIGKEEWGALHTNIGILFIVAGLLHTVLNLNAIVAYLKNKEKKFRVFTADFNIALAITLFVALFTLFNLPPVNSIQTLGTKIKDTAADKYGDPPYGHAETSTLETFCKRMELNIKDATKALEKAGIQITSGKETLSEIAKANKLTPQHVYNIIKPVETPEKKGAAFPGSPGFGFGRKSFSGFCKDYNLDPAVIIGKLQTIGIDARAEDTMKEIADRNETDPSAIFEAIRQAQE